MNASDGGAYGPRATYPAQRSSVSRRQWFLVLTGVVVAAGVALDFVMTNVVPAGRGRCRVLVTPNKGAALAIGDVDPKRADAALQRLLPSS